MAKIKFTDAAGSFSLEAPDLYSYLYFPLTDENGVMSSITPELGGDSKRNQNAFALTPVSADDLHNNRSSRNFWVLSDDGTRWSATGVSPKQQALKFSEEREEVRLEAGLLYHRITRVSKREALTAQITSFVPHTDLPMELTQIILKNDSAETRTLRSIAAFPIYGRSAANIRDHRHVTSLLNRIQTHRNGVTNKPTMAFDERGHQKNEQIYGVFGRMNGEEPIGFLPTVEAFIGEGGSMEAPRPILTDDLPSVPAGREIDGYECMGGLIFPAATVPPGGTCSYIVALAYGMGDTAALSEAVDPYLSCSCFDRLLTESRNWWQSMNPIAYRTGDLDFDRWMQWVDIQPVLRRIYGCSFLPHHDYGKGGRGWRDLWQDCLALLLVNPDGVRELLLNNFAGVRTDGTNATIIGEKPGEFIADRNGIARVWMDHGMWPWLTVKLYLDQTGDYALLLENAPYFKDQMIRRGEGTDDAWSAADGNMQRDANGRKAVGSVIEHLLIEHLTAFFDVGEHNHIRIRGADWNDALDMAEARGESVAFTTMYAKNMEELADALDQLSAQTGMTALPIMEELTELIGNNKTVYENVNQKKVLLSSYLTRCAHAVSGQKAEVSIDILAADLRGKAAWIKEHIRQTEWVEQDAEAGWYNGYYDNDGAPLERAGTKSSDARMMLTTQVFAIMSGTADDVQVRRIVRAADRYLYRAEVGGYRLNTDFHEVKLNMGRMFGFAYGQKENGAVFCHMAIMYANALYRRNFVREGWRVIHTLYAHLIDTEKSSIYPGVPEYIDASGRGLYHYLTGAGSWLMLTMLTIVLGVRGENGDLVLAPKLLPEQFDDQKSISVRTDFANRHIIVHYQNDAGENSAAGVVRMMTVGDNEISGNRISRERLLSFAEDHELEIHAKIES